MAISTNSKGVTPRQHFVAGLRDRIRLLQRMLEEQEEKLRAETLKSPPKSSSEN